MANPHWERSKFIPGIWKGKVLTKLYGKLMTLNPNLILDYEGEIRRTGDQVLFKDFKWRVFTDAVPSTILTIDKGHTVDITIRDAIDVQSDQFEMDRVTKDIAEEFIRGMEIPRERALFAAQIPVVEMQRSSQTFADRVRSFVVYGYKSLNIFRQATEVIANCKRRKMDMDETLRELDRAGF
jgi:hypothetical protein